MCASSHDGSRSAPREEGPKMSDEMQSEAIIILQSGHISKPVYHNETSLQLLGLQLTTQQNVCLNEYMNIATKRE